MDIRIGSFRGEAPRMTPRELPPNGAQVAINCRLQSGDLEAWRHFLLTTTLTHAADVRTIFKLRTAWLSWTDQVDVARGLIPGDTSDRIYLTSPAGAYPTGPRWTNYALATTGAAPYPVTTRPIGVPNPTTAPTLVVGTAAVPTISVADAGNQLATAWTTSPLVLGVSGVEQSALIGNPVPSYRLDYINNLSTPCFAYREFGVADSASVDMGVDVAFVGATVDAGVRVRCSATGSGLLVGIGVIGGTTQFFIGNASSWGGVESALVQTAPPPLDNTGATFYRIGVRTTLNPAGTLTVTAELLSGATVLATLTTTGSFDLGGYCGVDGSSSVAQTTFYDNFLVEGSGSLTAIQNIATNYVYTFVNDIGEESGPSPVSETILRPDGVSVTVTTPTSATAGFGITNKRIYRSVTGSSGTIFLLVSERPLAEATYVDEADDAEIGPDILESEDWDLPPEDLEGILALPNGIMAGFFENQLCFSAAGRPHAWPVRYRLTACAKIVAIANIDNTVVIGTQSQVQTATGTAPDTYTMSQPGEPQACVAKLSMKYVDDVGVVFASPDGYQVCAGSAGNVTNATSGIFTKRQWQVLDPTSIISAVHDGVLHFFCSPNYGAALPGVTRWDPANTFSMALSNANRTASAPTTVVTGMGSLGSVTRSTGKYYFEFLITAALAASGGNRPAVGLGASPFTYATGSASPTDGYYAIDQDGNDGGGFGASFVAGQRVMIAVDIDLQRFWSGVNGVWNFSGNPATGLNPRTGWSLLPGDDFAPLIWCQASGGGATLRTGPSELAYPVPAGFTAWGLDPPESTVGQPSTGYALDIKPDGFGLIQLGYHASACFSDLELDALHLVLDQFNEPTDPALLIPPTFALPGGPAIRIYEFDADPDSNLTYRWRGKLNLLPHPTAFHFAKVRAASFTNLVAKFIGDSVTKLSRAMTSLREFRLPHAGNPDDQYEVEFIGTNTVRTAQVAEDVEELI